MVKNGQSRTTKNPSVCSLWSSDPWGSSRCEIKRTTGGIPEPCDVVLPPPGLCECGCGATTRTAPQTANGKKWRRGRPLRFVKGHAQHFSLRQRLVYFWASVVKTEGCWEWTGPKNWQGYGMLGFRRFFVPAHRLAYWFAYGPIPSGAWILHRCDNRACVRPDHLFLGDALENNRDASRKGRSANGERNGWSKLTEEAIGQIRKRYGAGGVSQRAIAKDFGVSQRCIGNIVRGETWGHLKIVASV